MLGFLREVGGQAARFGAGAAAQYLAWRAAQRVSGYVPYEGFVLPASAAPRRAPMPSGLSCRQLGAEELRACAADPAYELGARFADEAEARGDCCIGVFAGAKLVSYSFNSRLATHIDADFVFRFPERWVYHFKAFTLPEWRGQHLHRCQIPRVVESFAATPRFQGLVTLVVRSNYASLASFRRLHFRPAFRFAFVGRDANRRAMADAPYLTGAADGTILLRAPGTAETFAVAKAARA
ncbi:MAG: hypothetical protein ACT4P3_15510 [Betaproteobacteria bacterium]